MNLDDLLDAHCEDRPPGTPTLPAGEVESLLALVPGWEVVEDGGRIRRTLGFDGFTAAANFVAGLAPLTNAEDHHPDVRLYRYRRLDVDYRTNSIGGLSLNDFIMAAKVNRLYESKA